MTNELTVLKELKVLDKDFKIYGDVDNPLFLAKDVASWIEHSRASEMIKAVDEDEKLTQTILASGQNREMWFLTEDGLYEVLMQSRKPIAKSFKKEVKGILKDIRKHGGSVALNREEEFVNNYFEGLSDDTKRLMITELVESNKKLKHKADKHDAFLDTEGNHTFTEVCKMLSTRAQDVNYQFTVSSTTLCKYLREKGILSKAKKGTGYANTPIKKYENYFNVVSRTVGEDKLVAQTMVKPNGVEFIYDMLAENKFSLFH